MLSINMSDVMNVLNSIKSYLIAFVVVLILAIVVMIAVGKQPKANKRLIRGEACIAIVLALLIVVNLICTGPMRTMLELVSARSDLSAETTVEATELVSQIVEEGVVLAKNEDAVLPVASGSKLNVFGWASTSPCYGGTGSGALNTAYPVTDLLTGLNEAGIETNTELSKFYTDYQSTRPDVGMWAQDWTLPEPNVGLYTEELMNNAKAFSDTAMIVITRVGGEGADLPDNMPAVVDGSWHGQDGVNQSDETYFAGVYDDTMNEGNDWDEGDHFLQLDNREEEMVDLVCQNFDKVIVVYNGANAFEMGWVNEHPQIKGVLLCPGTGQSGFTSFGRVVSGEVNPSGHTVDIYPVSMKDAPWWNNHGSFVYDNMKDYGLTAESMFAGTTTTENPSFVNYVEGIYVGYKFYETAAAEGLIDYDKSVVYPFGYGLSYTDFTQTMSDVSFDGTNASFSVTVTSNGTVAGKDVVEVYVNPPYTNGGIEKATANLVDFAKTGDIAPGASETVDFTIPVEQLASFDYQGKGCYVLEAGTYTLSANADSHTVYDAKTFDVAAPVVYDQNNKRESDKIPAVSQFDYTSIFLGECINFPLQRNVTFRSHGPLAPQILCHLGGTIAVMLVMNLFTCVWNPVTAAFGVPDALRNIVTTIATGGVAMVIIFAIDKTIFAEGFGEKKRYDAEHLRRAGAPYFSGCRLGRGIRGEKVNSCGGAKPETSHKPAPQERVLCPIPAAVFVCLWVLLVGTSQTNRPMRWSASALP